ELLEDAQTNGLLELDTDKKSRTYVVTAFGSELTARPAAAARAPRATSADEKTGDRPRRRRSSSRGGSRRSSSTTGVAPPAAPEAAPAATPPAEAATPPPPQPAPEPPPRRREPSAPVWAAAVELGLDAENSPR